MKSTKMKSRGSRVESRGPEKANPFSSWSGLIVAVLALAVLPSFARADITSDLILWYRFDETSGTNADDSSSSNHDGTLTGGASFDSSGKINGCVLLDGANEYVTVPARVWPSGGFTFAAWINKAAIDTYKVLFWIGNYQYALIDVTPFETVRGAIYRTDNMMLKQITCSTAANVIEANTWKHIAFTWNGGTAHTDVKTYVNGQLSVVFSDGALSGETNSNSLSAYLGTSGSNAFDGRLDDVRMYSRALSSDDIRDLYNWSGQVAHGVGKPPRFAGNGGGIVGIAKER